MIQNLRDNPKTTWLGFLLAAATAVISVPGILPEEWKAAANTAISAVASIALAFYASDPIQQ